VEPWHRLCFAQFHDALPGSSIALVYQEMVPELEGLAATCLQAAERELGAGGDGADHVFNVLPFPRLAWDGARLWRLGALGTGVAEPAAPVATSADLLDNGVVRARFMGGNLVAMSIAGRDLPLRGGGLTIAPDNPANYDAWDIDHHAHRLAGRISPTRLDVHGPGRLRGSVALSAQSRVDIDYVLLPGERHLRVELSVIWQEEHRLLRYEVDSGCVGTNARFGCAFGSIFRPQLSGGPQAEAMWEVPASRWAAALRDDGVGVALLARSQWGFSCRDGHLGVSLLRGPTYPDPRCDRGEHHLSLAIGAHADRFSGDELPTAAAAEALWAPLPRCAGAVAPLRLPALASLVPAWACPTAEGIELRLHEVAGGAGSFAVPGTPVDAVGVAGTRAAGHAYGPYAVLSLRLDPG
jgi:alpha-mannosidase